MFHPHKSALYAYFFMIVMIAFVIVFFGEEVFIEKIDALPSSETHYILSLLKENSSDESNLYFTTSLFVHPPTTKDRIPSSPTFLLD